ncbi:sorbosone dehydrogenase family protein [Candidatus Methylospira mobilis]|uniref:Sorbosone dehydrogenase family protein n=2 Tax=Candidatus Methylospira mobilis TaxID=1808979 RepID=A0A5Q0BRP4_9GAMM|nr:sorbosone dehydrogenase family protein [Candidatus Methylospira mobilis]
MPFMIVVLAAALTGCGEIARLPIEAGTGANPQLPPPNRTLIPTVNIAPSKGWPEGQKPLVAQGASVSLFAAGFDHPRWLYVLPNGDVLVAETNAPSRSDMSGGIKACIAKWIKKQAGAGGSSANRITLLRDADGDGVPETRAVFLDGLNSPFGMALVGNDFYVANTDALMRFPYRAGETRISQPGNRVIDLPAGTVNYHWTKNIIASGDGTRLYVTVGSNSNVAENGMDMETGRAAIWEVDLNSGSHRVFASGLRNPNGLAWEPGSGTLWTVVNERDELGSDLVPDYLTAVTTGGFYGWPYSYYGRHLDQRVQPQRPDLVAKAIIPDYALGTHTASLGLAFSEGAGLSAQFARGVFVAQHGSWNRNPRSGYKVVFIPFDEGKPFGMPVDVLSGFVSADGDAYGRPVGVAFDRQGALLVADDSGNKVWRVTANTTH